MTVVQAIILGLVQGLTEFLPISSSAHLFLAPYFFNWDYQGLGFDVALHWGTLLAVLVIFGKDYWRYLKGLFVGSSADRKPAWFLILGSVPAAVIGFLFESQAETVFRSPYVIVVTLAFFAFLLGVADRRVTIEGNPLTWKKVLLIGVGQAAAIIPGVSRSGITMTMGLFSKLNREQAARFSFLLSGPIIFGAGLVAIPDLTAVNPPVFFGFLSAALSGFLAIRFLLKFVSTHSFRVFIWYRYALAALIAITLLVK